MVKSILFIYLEKIQDDQLNDLERAIIPDQNGKFYPKSELSKDTIHQ
jgi:hypothetical protein